MRGTAPTSKNCETNSKGGGLSHRPTRVGFAVPMIDVVTGADRIVVNAQIGAPRDSVWRALTEEERIAQWWGGYVSLDARPGGRLTERWTDDGGREVTTYGEVVRLAAPRMLELTWADGRTTTTGTGRRACSSSS